MYSKDELSSKSITELLEIAHNYGIDVNTTGSEEELIYAILDKQAEVEGMKNPLGTKRRRTRIVKKDTDRVYTVSGKEGENFDMKKNKAKIAMAAIEIDAKDGAEGQLSHGESGISRTYYNGIMAYKDVIGFANVV